MNNCFGEVRWYKEDLANALEVQGFPVTENNVEKLYTICNSHWFTDYLIERGWEYIYSCINNEHENWDK